MGLYQAYSDLLHNTGEAVLEWADPGAKFRGYTQEWPLMQSETAFTICLAYVAFVLIGSRVMKLPSIPAIDAYPVKFLYNVSQIMLCSYMTLEGLLLIYRAGYLQKGDGGLGPLLPTCVGFDTVNPALANLSWLFYLSKIWDFWDTAFIILGKKWRQLSFLHVYHHLSVVFIFWLIGHVNYDGDNYLVVILNSFVHAVMYTYYFICMHTKIPETGRSLKIWWKSSLTKMQMVQFVTIISHGTYLYVTQCETTPVGVLYVYVGSALSYLVLFAEFYISSYFAKPPQKKKAA